ncbi:hypothetical protein MTR67_043674 [Solanum verrucosum]|uniref:Uncharacterized protein n=1 Tax=Solanum verrucosum TaxID=315347 RepID=A0AAF0UQR1_SOLVR|nr:hypothetical protein MTR67_043674 [Solanum verrucosum]
MKGIKRFERRGKPSPMFIGPFEILSRMDDSLSFEEEPMTSLDTVEWHASRGSRLSFVKVLSFRSLAHERIDFSQRLEILTLDQNSENFTLFVTLIVREVWSNFLILIRLNERNSMPPRRAYARNANACNADIVPLVLNHKVSNAKFQNAIHLLAQSMTKQNNQQVPIPTNKKGGSVASRV